jgi:CheY-like chemotaxis protein
MNDEKISRSSSDILVVDDVSENRKLLPNLLKSAVVKSNHRTKNGGRGHENGQKENRNCQPG